MSTTPTLNSAEAINALAILAQDAAGEISTLTISNAANAEGLPEEAPVLLQAGKTPQVISAKKFLEEWRFAPDRRKGTAKATTLHAFIELTVRHKDEHSALFAKTAWPNPSLTAVIDYHETDGSPRFAEHRIVYEFPLTEEIKAWISANKKPMSQKDFAEFVESNIADLSVPMDNEIRDFEALFRTKFANPTDLVELARGLSINVDSKIKSAFRNQTGEAEIAFETTHTAAAGGETIHVPGLFMLSLPVFVDGRDVRIPARLRYRVVEGKLVWIYELYKWENAIRDRVASDFMTAIKQTELPGFEGAPEA